MFSLWVPFFSRTPYKLWEGAQWTSHREAGLQDQQLCQAQVTQDGGTTISDFFLSSSLSSFSSPAGILPWLPSTGLSGRDRDTQKGTELAAEAGKQKQKWQKNLKTINPQRKQDLILPTTSRWDAVLLTGEREKENQNNSYSLEFRKGDKPDCLLVILPKTDSVARKPLKEQSTSSRWCHLSYSNSFLFK